jgi:hypothetical protein
MSKEQTEERCFSLCELDVDKEVIFQMDVPKIKENPYIYAMQKDGDMVYLFDYDDYEDVDAIFVTAIDQTIREMYHRSISWDALAGEYAGSYRLGNMVLSLHHIAVYDQILYIVESYYGDGGGDRIERILLHMIRIQENFYIWGVQP